MGKSSLSSYAVPVLKKGMWGMLMGRKERKKKWWKVHDGRKKGRHATDDKATILGDDWTVTIKM